MRQEYKESRYKKEEIPSVYKELITELGDKFDDIAFRWSAQHVPHLLLEHDGIVYSLCQFKKRKKWKVFFPYRSTSQLKFSFPTPDAAIQFILEEN